jgi:hypothetical protein
MAGPALKRAAVAHLQAVMDLSERRVCFIVGTERKIVRYQSCRPLETSLRRRLRELANERRRLGYQAVHPVAVGRRTLRVHASIGSAGKQA